MLRVRRALLNPVLQRRDVRLGQLLARFRRRHFLVRVGGGYSFYDFAFFRMPGDDGLATAQIHLGAFRSIEAEAGAFFAAFAFGFVGAVAFEAIVGEDFADVAIEIDRRGVKARGAGKRNDKQAQAES